MAVLPFRPTPFFANKNRAFWNLQLVGWGGAFLLRASAAIANGQPWDLLAVILVTTITGFSISMVLSVVFRQLIDRQPLVAWGMTVVILLVAVIVHASIDAWVQGIYFAGIRETTFAQRFIGLSYIPLTLLGGWSALYFAINYFLTVEEQADRLERAAGHVALPAQPAFPVQHAEFDQHSGAAEADRAGQCHAFAPVRFPASYVDHAARQPGHAGAGG